MEENKEIELNEQKNSKVEEGEDKEKKKNPQVTIKFSDETMYEDVVEYLNKYKNYNGTKIPNGTLIARAVKHYTESSKVNEAIEILPDALTNVFTGGGDAIEVAITTIRNTFTTLTTTTAAAVDERESKVRKHYEKRIASLEKDVDSEKSTVKDQKVTIDRLRNLLSVATAEQERAESESKASTERVESLELILKDKEQIISGLEDSKKSLMEQSTSKDAELSELRHEVKELSKTNEELSEYKNETVTQLKLKDQEILTLRNDEERLKGDLDNLKMEMSTLRSEHKKEITELKNESKQALAELKMEHKEEISKLKSDMDVKNNALAEENKNLSSQLKDAQAKINELYEQLMKSNQQNNEDK